MNRGTLHPLLLHPRAGETTKAKAKDQARVVAKAILALYQTVDLLDLLPNLAQVTDGLLSFVSSGL